jgi:uncharacterized membrane protein HdeD (DUF308 family)
MFKDDVETLYRRTKGSLVLRGLLGIAIGVFILARPLDGVAALALVIAWWALFDGISSIVHAVELRDAAPSWWVLLLGGAVSTLFGLAALWDYPVLSLSFAVVWTALWLSMAGVAGVWMAMAERAGGAPSWGWTLALGLLSLAAGVLAIAYPGVTLASLVGLIGGFALAGGILRLVAAARLRSFAQGLRRVVGTPARA